MIPADSWPADLERADRSDAHRWLGVAGELERGVQRHRCDPPRGRAPVGPPIAGEVSPESGGSVAGWEPPPPTP